jgi:carbon storage regulator CsrA
MLVLSRRPNQKILFPELGVSVEVCSVAKNAVRLGIEAPPAISIVRDELLDNWQPAPAAPARPSRHKVLNRLHTAGLGMHLAQKQLQAGLIAQAQASLQQALREHAELEKELTNEKPAAPAPHQRPTRQISALVVEDNRNECSLLAQFLRLHGITVETAGDGQEALDFLRAHDRPDVVLLDMRMPRCDGPATIAAIRGSERLHDMKVFAVTGAAQSECHLAQGPEGVDGWFTKPINPSKLIQEMNVALGRN